MKGIVLELQYDLLQNDCDILNALRKAHIIASKLKLSEFDLWIMQELNGYDNQENIPDYRIVHGELKAFNPYHGWIPATINNLECEQTLCERKVSNSISSIIELYKNNSGHIYYTFPGTVISELNKMFNSPIPMQFSLFISSHVLKEIVEHVKDCLLQWTLKLDEIGVIGEGMTFSQEEKGKVKELPQTINNYYGTTSVVNAPITNAQISNGNSNNNSFNFQLLQEDVKDIEDAISNDTLSKDDKETALDLLREIKDKIEAKKKPNIIKAALVGLKDFLINVGSSVAAALIENKMNGL